MTQKILLVEDEAVIAMHTAGLIRKHGYETLKAYSGEAAVEAVEQNADISLVLMDIDLGSGIDGTEAARRILKIRRLPVVFLTSHAELEMVEKVKNITRYGYVLKSSGEFVLLESIHMAFELFEAHRQTEEREERYRSLFADNNSVMLLYEPRTGEIVDANPAAVAFYGWSYDELTQMSVRDIFQLSAAEYEARIQRAQDKQQTSFLTRHRTSGGIRDVEAFASPITVQGRQLFYAIIHDISEHVKNEREVEHLKSLFQYIIEHNPSLIAVLDDQLRHMYVSRSFLRDYRLELNDIIGKSHYEVFPEIPPEWRNAHRRALAGEVLGSDDDTFVRADGATDYVAWECRPWFRDDGSVGGIIIYSEVLNRYHDALREIELREENLRITLNSIGDAVISTDVHGRIEHMNPVAESLTGWKLEDAAGKKLAEVFRIINARSRQPVDNPVRKVLETGKIQGLANHTVLISRSGREYQVADSAAPILDEQGVITGVVLVFRDVTEQYEQDRRLAESEKKYRELFDNAPVGIFMTNSRGEALHVNPRMARMVGAASQEDAVANFRELSRQLYLHPERREEFVRQLNEKGEVENFEYEARSLGGGIRWFSMNARRREPLPGGGFLIDGFTLDVSRRKEAVEALERANGELEEQKRELKQALREKTFLVREMNHRVKNNLAMIISLLSLKEADGGADFTDVRSQINAIRIVHEKLYSSDDADVTHINFREYCDDLLRTIFESFSDRDIRVENRVQEVILEPKNAMELGLITNEIATNAVKYGFPGEGEAVFSVDLRKDPADGGYLFVLANNGNPFPQEIDPDRVTTLGLRLVTALVDQLGGSLSLQKTPSPVFTIRIPELNTYDSVSEGSPRSEEGE